MKGNLAVAQGVEELPGSELAVHADLEVARANAAEVHAGVRVLAGQVEPRFGRGEQLAPPALQLIHRQLACTPRRAGQQARCRPRAHEPEELPAVEVVRPTVSRTIAFTHGKVP